MHNRIRGNMALGNNKTEPGTQYQSSNLSLESSKPHTQHHQPVWSQHLFNISIFIFFGISCVIILTGSTSSLSGHETCRPCRHEICTTDNPRHKWKGQQTKIINGKVDRQTNQPDQLMLNLLAEYVYFADFLVGHLYHYPFLYQSVCSLNIIIFCV